LNNTIKFRDTAKKALIDFLEENEFTRPNDLLSMQLWYLTKDKIEELKKELEDKLVYLETLQNDTAKKMYERELKALEI
jgi:hypothetical protein